MGTNFYHRTNICECCKRYDERHIGKSSAGWTFSFQGFKPFEWEEETPCIESYHDWLGVLAEGEIWNEYGDKISLDEFKQMVEAKRHAPNNHTLYCRRDYPDLDTWLDSEGHSFSGGDFS